MSCGRPPRSPLPGPPDSPIKLSPVIQSVAPASWLLAVLEPRRSRALTLTPALPRAAASSAASAGMAATRTRGAMGCGPGGGGEGARGDTVSSMSYVSMAGGDVMEGVQRRFLCIYLFYRWAGSVTHSGTGTVTYFVHNFFSYHL